MLEWSKVIMRVAELFWERICITVFWTALAINNFSIIMRKRGFYENLIVTENFIYKPSEIVSYRWEESKEKLNVHRLILSVKHQFLKKEKLIDEGIDIPITEMFDIEMILADYGIEKHNKQEV